MALRNFSRHFANGTWKRRARRLQRDSIAGDYRKLSWWHFRGDYARPLAGGDEIAAAGTS
jgi:hypothetical protein